MGKPKKNGANSESEQPSQLSLIAEIVDSPVAPPARAPADLVASPVPPGAPAATAGGGKQPPARNLTEEFDKAAGTGGGVDPEELAKRLSRSQSPPRATTPPSPSPPNPADAVASPPPPPVAASAVPSPQPPLPPASTVASPAPPSTQIGGGLGTSYATPHRKTGRQQLPASAPAAARGPLATPQQQEQRFDADEIPLPALPPTPTDTPGVLAHNVAQTPTTTARGKKDRQTGPPPVARLDFEPAPKKARKTTWKRDVAITLAVAAVVGIALGVAAGLAIGLTGGFGGALLAVGALSGLALYFTFGGTVAAAAAAATAFLGLTITTGVNVRKGKRSHSDYIMVDLDDNPAASPGKKGGTGPFSKPGSGSEAPKPKAGFCLLDALRPRHNPFKGLSNPFSSCMRPTRPSK